MREEDTPYLDVSFNLEGQSQDDAIGRSIQSPNFFTNLIENTSNDYRKGKKKRKLKRKMSAFDVRNVQSTILLDAASKKQTKIDDDQITTKGKTFSRNPNKNRKMSKKPSEDDDAILAGDVPDHPKPFPDHSKPFPDQSQPFPSTSSAQAIKRSESMSSESIDVEQKTSSNFNQTSTNCWKKEEGKINLKRKSSFDLKNFQSAVLLDAANKKIDEVKTPKQGQSNAPTNTSIFEKEKNSSKRTKNFNDQMSIPGPSNASQTKINTFISSVSKQAFAVQQTTLDKQAANYPMTYFSQRVEINPKKISNKFNISMYQMSKPQYTRTYNLHQNTQQATKNSSTIKMDLKRNEVGQNLKKSSPIVTITPVGKKLKISHNLESKSQLKAKMKPTPSNRHSIKSSKFQQKNCKGNKKQAQIKVKQSTKAPKPQKPLNTPILDVSQKSSPQNSSVSGKGQVSLQSNPNPQKLNITTADEIKGNQIPSGVAPNLLPLAKLLVKKFEKVEEDAKQNSSNEENAITDQHSSVKSQIVPNNEALSSKSFESKMIVKDDNSSNKILKGEPRTVVSYKLIMMPMPVEKEKQIESQPTLMRDTQLQSQSQMQMQTQSQIQTQLQLQSQLQSHSQTQSQSQLQTQLQSQSQMQLQLQSQSQMQMQSQSQLQTQSQLQLLGHDYFKNNTSSSVSSSGTLKNEDANGFLVSKPFQNIVNVKSKIEIVTEMPKSDNLFSDSKEKVVKVHQNAEIVGLPLNTHTENTNNQLNSFPTDHVLPLANAPRQVKEIQKDLMLLLHAQQCFRGKDKCTKELCEATKNHILHSETCEAASNCFNCRYSKQLLQHWASCRSNECPFCVDVLLSDDICQSGSNITQNLTTVTDEKNNLENGIPEKLKEIKQMGSPDEKNNLENGVPEDLKEMKKILDWFKKDNKNVLKEITDLAGVPEGFVGKVKNGKITKLGETAKALHAVLNNKNLMEIDFENETAILVDSSKRRKGKLDLFNIVYLMCHKLTEEDLKNVAEFFDDIEQNKNIILTSYDDELLNKMKSFAENPIKQKETFKYSHSMTNAERKAFLNKVKEHNELLSVRQIKSWDFEINSTTFCTLLMIHNGDKSTKKILAEHTRKFQIDEILKSFNLHNTSPRVSVARVNLGPKLESLGHTYSSQELIGNELFETIKTKLRNSSEKTRRPTSLECFDDFRFLILLPNRVSLEKQTINRLEELKTMNPEEINEQDVQNVVRINIQSKAMSDKWNDFIKSAKDNANVFHLIIHDECHWAAGRNQSAFKFLGFDNGDYHLDESNNIRPNLFTILVSATPFNFFTSTDLKDEDVLNWNRFLQNSQTAQKNPYFGLSEMRQSGKIITNSGDETDFHNYPRTRHLEFTGLRNDIYLVLLDYICSLVKYANHTNEAILPNSTFESISKCIKEGKLIVIRLPKAKDDLRYTDLVKDVFRKVIERLGLKVEVMVNSPYDDDKEEFSFVECEERAFENARKRNKSVTQRKDLELSDFEGIPMIMLIVERGRMGDTFPSSCIRFDLRVRYSQITDFTSIIQDIGRTFGYNERPTLVLSKEADNFLQDVWDDTKREISWEHFKNLRRTIMLGKNTRRRMDEDIESDEDTEDSRSELQLFSEIFEADSNDPVMLYNLHPAAFKHRIILKAEPQIGKTGAFMYLILKFCKHLRNNNRTWFTDELSKLTNKYYDCNLLPKTAEFYKTPEGQEEHKYYLELLQYARKKRIREDILEPSKWAAKSLVYDLVKRGRSENGMRIADFGCGDMEFAKFLAAEINGKNLVHLHLEGYDISTNPIPKVSNSSNLTISAHEGINCANKSLFKEAYYDFIICTCALWGMGDSWRYIITCALRALKICGRLILVEFTSRFPRENLQNLHQIGLGIVPQRLPNIDLKKFNEKFTAVIIKKEDYHPNDDEDELLNILNR